MRGAFPHIHLLEIVTVDIVFPLDFSAPMVVGIVTNAVSEIKTITGILIKVSLKAHYGPKMLLFLFCKRFLLLVSFCSYQKDTYWTNTRTTISFLCFLAISTFIII
jgi:hypothetical protein